ncbi:alpha/beta hydrolase family esterase [Pseudaestuariivita rosea]|uniref:extracellular catalytic domain type 1 short-chain-length polyhydroxyalkanoate depolymerase n=1 Tax=Pseudaestuariivita rosea TaxID=2763263 RepID=UPI001ABB49DE|nr:PHB depolymerase family esterase [Pseudaestuariivita rosea]
MTLQKIDRFDDDEHRSDLGVLSYKLFTPAYRPKRPPLLIMLHGCRQTPGDFATGTEMNDHAAAKGVIVAYPRQRMMSNLNRCWNWFEPRHQTGLGEAGQIMGLVNHLISSENCHPRRVYLAGLSAGASMVAILCRLYPRRFAAAGVHSGVPAGAADTLSTAITAMKEGNLGHIGPGRVPMIVFQGAKDRVVSQANASRLAGLGRWRPWPLKRQSVFAAGGLDCTRTRIARGIFNAKSEHWLIDDLDHAWSGGETAGSYTSKYGPNASAEMMRFFLRH